MVQLLAAMLDVAFIGKLAEHPLELGAVGVLHAEVAREFARADFTRLLADEGEDLGFAGAGCLGRGSGHEE
jgi:hypothetical protein